MQPRFLLLRFHRAILAQLVLLVQQGLQVLPEQVVVQDLPDLKVLLPDSVHQLQLLVR